jgi:signal transduction histidine kinase
MGIALNASAQYIDHRNHKVDSLEQVLATNPPTGADLLLVYQELMRGYRQINGEKSMDYARKIIDITENTGYFKVLSLAYFGIALQYYNISQYDSANFYYDKASLAIEGMKNSEKYTESEIDDISSQLYGNTGNLYNIQGKYYEAIEYYTKALKIFEKYGWKESQANAYSNIGQMYLAMDNYEQAETNAMKLDALANELNDSLFIAYAKTNLSHIYLYHHKDYAQALENADIAYRYFFAHPEEGEFKATALNLLADIYLSGYNDDLRAEEYATQALQISDTPHITERGVISLRLLSSIYLKRSEWRKAEQLALQALEADSSEPANTLALYENLAKACAHLGNPQKAAEYIDKSHALQASWSNRNYQSALTEMEVKYETEKKELRIAAFEDERRMMLWLGLAGAAVLLLALSAVFFLWRWTVQKKRLAEKQRHIAEQQVQLAEQQVKQLEQEKQLIATYSVLDGETQERTRLARDLHDGLGSMLTGVKLNLSSMAKEAGLESANGKRFNKALGLLDESMRELRRVAHHLMPESLSRYGLKTALADFCDSISDTEFNYYGSGERFDQKLEVVIYRIAHELVNNALKHAGASHILVQIVQEPDRIALAVEDNGCGFNPQAATKGSGLQNIRTRVASFNGTMDVNTLEGRGTEINAEFGLIKN